MKFIMPARTDPVPRYPTVIFPCSPEVIVKRFIIPVVLMASLSASGLVSVAGGGRGNAGVGIGHGW
jgi:hypothetical protein